MEEKYELKDEELKQVSGGSIFVNGWAFDGLVKNKEEIEGAKYYFVSNGDSSDWIYGKLIKSYNKDIGTDKLMIVRYYMVQIENFSSINNHHKGFIDNISSEVYSIYRKGQEV